MFTLEAQEVPVAAPLAFRKAPADSRSRRVDGAASLFGVEELADPSEVLIILTSHHALVAVRTFGEALFRRFMSQLEVARQARHIRLRQLYDGV